MLNICVIVAFWYPILLCWHFGWFLDMQISPWYLTKIIPPESIRSHCTPALQPAPVKHCPDAKIFCRIWSLVPSELGTGFHTPGICFRCRSRSVWRQLLPPWKHLIEMLSLHLAAHHCDVATSYLLHQLLLHHNMELTDVLDELGKETAFASTINPCSLKHLGWQICPKCCASWIPFFLLLARQGQAMWCFSLYANTEKGREEK